MAKHSDLTFITNEEGQSLLERFKVLIQDTDCFDVLVGYFYSSGFHSLYKSLENTTKIRILIGIRTDKEIVDWIKSLKEQKEFLLSHAEVKELFSQKLVQEMDNSQISPGGFTKILSFPLSLAQRDNQRTMPRHASLPTRRY